VPPRFPRYEKIVGFKGAKRKVLEEVIKSINTRYKKEKKRQGKTLTTLHDSIFAQERPYISSGILPIDCCLCFGMGFPGGGIIEIYGPEASLKTAIVENTLAESQRKGYYTGLFAAEYSLNYKRMKSVGLDENLLLVMCSKTIEDFYKELRDVVHDIRAKDKRTPIVVGWDSIAATPTRTELEHKAGLAASDMGRMALQLSKFFRRLVRFLFLNNVCLLCVNQTRTNLAQMYGNKEVTTGGKALRFYAWVRCRVARIKSIKGPDDEEIGMLCNFTTVKNKFAPPFRKCKLAAYWKKGIDPVFTVWEFCIDKKIIERSEQVYKYKGHVLTKNSFAKFYSKYRQEVDAALRKASLGKE